MKVQRILATGLPQTLLAGRPQMQGPTRTLNQIRTLTRTYAFTRLRAKPRRLRHRIPNRTSAPPVCTTALDFRVRPGAVRPAEEPKRLVARDRCNLLM